MYTSDDFFIVSYIFLHCLFITTVYIINPIKKIGNIMFIVNKILSNGFSIMMQGVSGLSALTAGFKALGDENLTTEQKFTNFITSIGISGLQLMDVAKKIKELKDNKIIKTKAVKTNTLSAIASNILPKSVT